MSCPRASRWLIVVSLKWLSWSRRHRGAVRNSSPCWGQWPDEAWGRPVTPMHNGPSYIDVGAVLDSQSLAFVLFAVGKVLGLWDIITPETLGIEGEKAGELAGLGFVMISGFHRSRSPQRLRKDS